MNIVHSTPFLLQPMAWCGRQWRTLAHIETTNSLKKTIQVIERIIPGLLLTCATIVAFIIGLGAGASHEYSYQSPVMNVSPKLRNHLVTLGFGPQMIADDLDFVQSQD